MHCVPCDDIAWQRKVNFLLAVLFPWCACTCRLCMQVVSVGGIHMYAHACEGQGLMSGFFFCCSPSCSLRQGLSLEPRTCSLDNHLAPGMPDSSSQELGLHGCHTAPAFTRVQWIRSLVLTLAQQVLGQPSHVPGSSYNDLIRVWHHCPSRSIHAAPSALWLEDWMQSKRLGRGSSSEHHLRGFLTSAKPGLAH